MIYAILVYLLLVAICYGCYQRNERNYFERELEECEGLWRKEIGAHQQMRKERDELKNKMQTRGVDGRFQSKREVNEVGKATKKKVGPARKEPKRDKPKSKAATSKKK